MKTYVLGDVHGAYRALLQVLERSGFNLDKDRLICLGDIVDGWPDVMECFDELLKIKDLIYIWGNHDDWYYKFLKFGQTPYVWTSQGGDNTIKSYMKKAESGNINFIQDHLALFNRAYFYYVDDNNRLFVHGGFNWHIPIGDNILYDFMWDRHAFETACSWEAFTIAHPTKPSYYFKNYSEVFIGHTCTNHGVNCRIGNTLEPLHVSNLWNLDQGAGWDGKLSIMNVDTKEFFQSDLVQELYPEERGRN